jgi:hypothetical protein
MYIFTESIRELETWIQKEVAFERDLSEGDHGPEVRRVQEWLNLQWRASASKSCRPCRQDLTGGGPEC